LSRSPGRISPCGWIRKNAALVGNGPHRLERRIVEVASVHVRSDLRAAQSKRCHGAVELVGGAARILQRQGGQSQEAVAVTIDDGGNLAVLHGRAGRRERRLLMVEEGVNRGGEELHGHAMPVHVAQPEIEIEGGARHPVLHDLAVDFHDGAPAGADQLRRHAGRFASQPPDRRLGQDVGVHVDGDAWAHRSDRPSSAWRHCASCARHITRLVTLDASVA
jgi:hypothetical protein